MKIILNALKSILLPLLGEKLIAHITFSFLTWLAGRTDTNIDDNVVKAWKETYYAKDAVVPVRKEV